MKTDVAYPVDRLPHDYIILQPRRAPVVTPRLIGFLIAFMCLFSGTLMALSA